MLVFLFSSFLLCCSYFPPNYPEECKAWSRRCGAAVDVEVMKDGPQEQCVLRAPLDNPSRPKCMLEPFTNRANPDKYEKVDETCLIEQLPASCTWVLPLKICAQTAQIRNAGTARGPFFSLRLANGQVTPWRTSSFLQSFQPGDETCVSFSEIKVVGEFSLRRHVDALGIRTLSGDGWCLESIYLTLEEGRRLQIDFLSVFAGRGSSEQEQEAEEEEEEVERLDWDLSRMREDCAPCGSSSFSRYGEKKCYWFDEGERCHTPQMVLYNDKRMGGEEARGERGEVWATQDQAECSFFYNSQFALGETLFENVFHLFITEYLPRPKGEALMRHSCASSSDCSLFNQNAICDATPTSTIPFPYPRCRSMMSWKQDCTDKSDNLCRSGFKCEKGKCEPGTVGGTLRN